MSQKNRYTLTAAIGDKPAGSTIELTDDQAANPLYAPRIVKTVSGGINSISYEIDVEKLKAELLGEFQEQADGIIEAARAEAVKIESDAKTAAATSLEEAQTKADGIIEAAKLQADALVKATVKK